MREELTHFINKEFTVDIVAEEFFRDQLSFRIRSEALSKICEALESSEQFAFKFLADITCVDWLGHDNEKDGRLEVVYNLYSYKHSYRFFLKVRLDSDKPNVKSLTYLWNGANWMEREVYDLFGVIFEGHPNLTKILTPDELDGHPLRKDFPLTWEQPHFSWNKDQPPEVIK